MAQNRLEIMLDEIRTQGDRLLTRFPEYERKIDEVAKAIGDSAPSHLILTGCGDSHYAGLGTRLAFEHLAGISTEAIEAQELRYLIDYLPAGSCVIGISESGQPQSTNDALALARRRGLLAVAFTSQPSAPIVASADICLDVATHRGGSVPGTYSYLANMINLYLLAIRLGISNKHLQAKQAAKWRGNVREELSHLGNTADHLLPVVREYVQEVGVERPFYILGAGPTYSTALFGAAKLFEASELLGVPVQLEEWGHEQALVTKAGERIIVLAPNGQVSFRIASTIECICSLGGTPVVVGPARDELALRGCRWWKMDAPSAEILDPISYSVPMGLLALATAELMGSIPFAGDRPERLAAIKRLLWVRPEA